MALLGALGHLANLGQFAELTQGHTHHQEQLRWTRRNYELDSQALKVDLLGAAKSDVRGTYDTYVERLDSLLLLNALLLPFALNTLQFSDPFLPGFHCHDEGRDPQECIEVRFPWIHTLWVYLVAIDLIAPFWSILMLLGCKHHLDGWLQKAQDNLQEMRRSIQLTTNVAPDDRRTAKQLEEAMATEQQGVVEMLGNFIVCYQDDFMEMWSVQCAPLVYLATRLLWSSATIAFVLTAYMCWIYLENLQYNKTDNLHFAVLTGIGIVAPLLYIVWHKRYRFHQPAFMDASNALDAGLTEVQLQRSSEDNFPGRNSSPLIHRSAARNHSSSSGTRARTVSQTSLAKLPVSMTSPTA